MPTNARVRTGAVGALKQAQALLDLGPLDEAKAKLDAADPWLRDTGNREQASDQQVALAEYYLRTREPEAARRACAQAVALAAASRSRAAALRARLARGTTLVALGDARPALTELTSAAREADALGDALLRVRASEALSRALLLCNRLPEAEAAAQRALRLAERYGWEAGLYRLNALFGRILARKGDAAGAAAQHRQSARRIARLAEGLSDELRAAFQNQESVREVALKLGAPSTPTASRRAAAQ